MGILDKLRGVKRPEDDVSAVSRSELEQRLLGLNHPQVPFSVGPSDDADLQTEWRIVDASWYEIFAKAGLEKSHKIFLGFNEEDREVRALEEAWEVEWRAGVPNMRLSMEKQQGRTFGSVSFGRGYAFKGVNPLSFGEVYDYRFNVSEMKDPIVDTITAAGWSYVPVMTKGKLRQ
jgi:hypothetical protein